MSEKEIGDYFSMLFARGAVGLFFRREIFREVLLIFAKKSRQGKLVQIFPPKVLSVYRKSFSWHLFIDLI